MIFIKCKRKALIKLNIVMLLYFITLFGPNPFPNFSVFREKISPLMGILIDRVLD